MKTKLELFAFIIFALAGTLRVEAQMQPVSLSSIIGTHYVFLLLASLNGDGNMGPMQNGTPVGAPVQFNTEQFPMKIGYVTESGFGSVQYGGVQVLTPNLSLTADFNGGPPTPYYDPIDRVTLLTHEIYEIDPINVQVFNPFNLPDPSGGLYGTGVAVGDFNGDGIVDRIVGTTYTGGANDSGTVFLMNIDGSQPKSVSLPACPNGFGANGVCVDAKNDVIVTGGTAGANGQGGIFMLPGGPGSGFPTIEHDFSGWDGYQPENSLTPGQPFTFVSPGSVQKAGAKPKNASLIPLYGVTFFGGTNGNGPGTGGYGTVYKINNDGSGFQTLYVFSSQRATNGYGPAGGLALSGNTLYGTTSGGGTGGSGTLFKIDTSGSNFMVLKNFSAYGVQVVNNAYNYTNSDGEAPEGSLFLSGNTLYGTTLGGGTNGGGVVFSINTNGGNFTVLHHFSVPVNNGNYVYTNIDGGGTRAGVILSGNTLFGTTPYGGTNGGGTLFAIILPSPPWLNIAPAGGNFNVSWRSSATNFMLQKNLTLNSLTWSNFNGTVNDDGTNKSVSVIPAAGNAFFRLMNTNGP